MRYLRFSLRGLVLGLAIFCGVSAKATEILPVKLDKHGRMLVPVEIYGRMQVRDFLFDTAARYPLFLNKDSKAMGIRAIEKGTLNHMSSAGLLRVPVAHVEAYLLGDRMIEEAVVGFFPDWAGADGLMGNDAFHGYVVHWQPADGHLRVYPNLAPISNNSWMHLGGRAGKSFNLIVTTEYEGKEIDVVIATGVSRSIIDQTIVNELIPDFWKPGTLDEDRDLEPLVRALSPEAENYTPVPMPGFAIGAWRIENFRPLAGYVDRVELTGYMNSRVIVLGADVLSRQELAFDFRDFHLWVKHADMRQTEVIN